VGETDPEGPVPAGTSPELSAQETVPVPVSVPPGPPGQLGDPAAPALPYALASGARWAPPPGGYAPAPPRRPTYVPGPFFIGLTFLVLTAGVVGSSGLDLSFLALVSITAALTIGFVWIVAFAVAASDTRLAYSRRTWARWAVPPVIFFVAVALMTSGFPTTTRFRWSQPALENTVVQLRAGNHVRAGWIGLLDVRQVRVVGQATFFDLQGRDDCSYALASRGNDPDVQAWLRNAWDATDYGDGWWYGCTSNFSD
jgi:hypothetical protein